MKNWTRFGILISVFLVVALGGCVSTGNLGLVSKSMGDPLSLLSSNRTYQEMGPVKGEACRYILLGVIPWGDSTVTKAVSDALIRSKSDALINLSVSSSLYSFVPIYNVLCYTCTSVEGIAIKFEPQQQPK
jgi:hypothetical protein